MMFEEPLSPHEARRLIRDILENGSVALAVDVTNVLRGGVVEPGELENGTWRYRVRTARIAVVTAFRSELELRVVTAWRFKS
jgi:hypothetical protein